MLDNAGSITICVDIGVVSVIVHLIPHLLNEQRACCLLCSLLLRLNNLGELRFHHVGNNK